jgi:hypothetical protein
VPWPLSQSINCSGREQRLYVVGLDPLELEQHLIERTSGASVQELSSPQ